MSIDQASFDPVYRQLARILREQIRAGELRDGQALPSEASLSQRFGVGRDAVIGSLLPRADADPAAALGILRRSGATTPLTGYHIGHGRAVRRHDPSV